MNLSSLWEHLDENLTWNHHVKAVKKASSAVFALSNVRNLLPSNIKHTIYNSLFRSFVEYGISAWGRNKSPETKKIACSKNVQSELSKMQKQLHILILFFLSTNSLS